MGLELYNLPFYNNSGETIPPFAVMQVDQWKDDANDRDYFRVRKPNGSGKLFLFNGPQSIAAAGDGMGSRAPGVHASYNNAATPAVDEEWGPVNGSWLLATLGSGFSVIGDLETIGVVNVVRVATVGAESGDVIRVEVNDATGVASGDATFAFDNAIPIVGETAIGTAGTAQNIYQQNYADNDVVFLFWNPTLSRWETERGGTAGSQVIYFELTQDKAYADAAKLAKPVDAAGAIVSGADAFYVVDDNANFYGKAAVGGAEGYRGHAWKFIDDYSAGVPGYRIIDMEGPAHFLTGVLSGSYSVGGTTFTPSTTQIWGRPSRGKRLPATGDITVYDDDDVASAAVSGDKWLIAWNEAAANYTFVVPLEPGGSRLQWGVVYGGTMTAATGQAVAGWGSGDVQFYDDDGVDDGSPITADNPFPAEFVDGAVVCCDRSKTPPRLVSGSCETY